MKIAAYLDQGRPAVGIVSSDLQSVLPLELSAEDAARGAQAIVELMAAGKAMPSTGAPVGIDAVQLIAPLPRPRRNLFCVGKNYHAHAREFAGSGFDSSAKSGGEIPSAPIIFTKGPECVIATGEPIVIPAGVSTAIDYEANSEKIKDVLPESKDALIVAYCGGPQCGAYKTAVKAAVALGYTNVKHLTAGISGWKDAGEKTEKTS